MSNPSQSNSDSHRKERIGVVTSNKMQKTIVVQIRRKAIHPKFGTPLRSVLLNSVWASVLVLWGNFEQILFLNAFEIWLFFILAGISVFILRNRGNHSDSFVMLGYPWVPILFTLVSVWLCLTTVLHAPREALFGTFIILAGAPVYFLLQGRETPPS